MMIFAIAIDDEPKALKVIGLHVSKLKNIELVADFTDPLKAVSFLRENPVDLVFLDINMPRMTGMDLLAELKVQPHLVFTTAYSEYALDSYSYNAVEINVLFITMYGDGKTRGNRSVQSIFESIFNKRD